MQRYCFRPAPTHPYLEYPPPPPQPTITEEPVKDSAGKTIGTISVKKDAKGKVTSRVLKIASTLTAVPPSAFANRKLTAVIIPSAITSIGNRSFADNSLTELTIPTTVTSIGAEAFKGNPGLKLVNISPTLLNNTAPNAFPAGVDFKDSLGGITRITTDAAGTITAKSLEIPASLTTVPPSAFANLRLTAVIIPRTVGAVGAGAFKGNPDIKSVVISQSLLNKISADAFPSSAVFTDHSSKVITRWVTEVTTDADGSKITLTKDNNGRGKIISKTLDLSSTVTAVPASKFANKELTAIRIPPETTSIGNQAFADNKLTELTIPSTVASIGTEAFKGNPGLKSVNISPNLLDNTSPNAFPAGVDFKDRLGGITRITTNATAVTNPDGTINAAGTTIIAKSLEIPASLTAIPNGSTPTGGFYSSNDFTSLNFVLPSSLTSIGDRAFRNNTLLTSVTIPNSVTRIGDGAFSDNRIDTIIIPDSVTVIEGFAFDSNSASSLQLGSAVQTIGEAAFRRNNITSVTIPASVRTIGPWAFRDNRLTSVTIPTTVTSIGQRAFAGNTGLTSVTISRALKTAAPANAFPTGVTFTDHAGATIP